MDKGVPPPLDHEDLPSSWGSFLSLGLRHSPPPPPLVEYIPIMRPQQQVHNFLPSQEQQCQDQHQHQEVVPPRVPILPVDLCCPHHLPTQPAMGDAEPDTVHAPFPWATTKPATVHMLDHLLSQGLTKIIGKVRCKGCGVERNIEFDLVEKFQKMYSYIANNMCDMNDRAPKHWERPVLPTCESCGRENSLKPIISNEINWLFLFLGELIGCCTIEQLKYFCKHTDNHMTGAKDRLVYQTYVTLCRQLQPNRTF